MTAPAYCVAADVKQAAGRFDNQQPLTTEETNRINTAIPQAQAMVEKMTGTFFYSQHLQITTESVQVRQKRLFLPVPCISLDNNQITENGVTLTLGTDFVLYQPKDGQGIPLGPGWLEKLWNPQNLPPFSPWPQCWTNIQQGIVISGMFGYSSVPPDITRATAFFTAQICGMVTQNYVDGAGIARAALNLKRPDWVDAILKGRTVSSMDEQFFDLKVLA